MLTPNPAGESAALMIDENSPLAAHKIINLAVSSGGPLLRPRRLRELAGLYGLSKSLCEKWARPAQEPGTGKASPIDRLDALLVSFHDYCPQASVLVVEHVQAVYELLTMNSSTPISNLDLARELIEVVGVLLDPDNSDDGTAAIAEIARAKSVCDRALAHRRNPPQPDRKPKFDAKASARLAMASRS